jgi:hypothetical protein
MTSQSAIEVARPVTRPVPPIGLPWLLVGVIAGLGVIVASTSRYQGTLSALLARPTAIEWSDTALLGTIAPAVAVLMSLILIRWWPWLLLGGTLLALGDTVGPIATLVTSHPYAASLAVAAGEPLVVLAVLAAAAELLAAGWRGLGAAAAGGTVGAVLIGRALVGAPWIALPAEPAGLRRTLTVVGLAGAAAVIVRRPGGGRPAIGTVTVADVLAALLVFTPAIVHSPPISGILGLDQGMLRRPYLLVAAAGMLAVVITLLVAAMNGPTAGAAAVVAALVQVGVVTSVLLAFAVVALHPGVALEATVAGAASGMALAVIPWRAALAVALCIASAAAAVLAGSAIDLSSQRSYGDDRLATLGAGLLALVVATAVVTVAAAAPAAAARGRLPVLLGPIAAALVLGANQVLHGIYNAVGSAGQPEGADRMPISAALLMTAAAATAGLVAIMRRRDRASG